MRELAYSDEERTLDVVWVSGPAKTYRFFDVSPEVFEWLLQQRSKGGFIRRKIIGHYREVRLDGRPDGSDLQERLEESVRAIGTAPPPNAEEE